MATPSTLARKLHQEAAATHKVAFVHDGPFHYGFSRGSCDAPEGVQTPADAAAWAHERALKNEPLSGPVKPGEPALCILSAKLRAHRTTGEDWARFGAVCAAVGVPRDVCDAEMKDDAGAQPRGSYYFVWIEPGVGGAA